MSREVRMVPPNWEHPKMKGERWNFVTMRCQIEEIYQPLMGRTHQEAMADWQLEYDRIESGHREIWEGNHYPTLESWIESHDPPDAQDYRPYSDEEATWVQAYETTTEGTPVSPPFATKEELIEYLVNYGDDYHQEGTPNPWDRSYAERFIEKGWKPTGMFRVTAGVVVEDNPETGVSLL